MVIWPLSAQAQHENIPLDTQIDINVPEKKDPIALKKGLLTPKVVNEIEEKTSPSPTKAVSYSGIWLVKQSTSSCQNVLNDFKIRISGKEIDTFIGMDVEGFIKNTGAFEMDAATIYWSIKFIGMLKNKSGQGIWTRKQSGKKKCTGTVKLTRVGD